MICEVLNLIILFMFTGTCPTSYGPRKLVLSNLKNYYIIHLIYLKIPTNLGWEFLHYSSQFISNEYGVQSQSIIHKSIWVVFKQLVLGLVSDSKLILLCLCYCLCFCFVVYLLLMCFICTTFFLYFWTVSSTYVESNNLIGKWIILKILQL